MAIWYCYWHLVVNNDNFTLLLISSGQEWPFHILTDIWRSRMAISHCYWHVGDQNGNFTLLLTSSGQEWQLHILTDIWRSTITISHCYWHVVVKNSNFTLLLTSSGQEWHFCHEIDRKTFIYRVNLGMWPLKLIVLEKWSLLWGF